MWKCHYCGFINPDEFLNCGHCPAPGKFREEVEEEDIFNQPYFVGPSIDEGPYFIKGGTHSAGYYGPGDSSEWEYIRVGTEIVAMHHHPR